MITTGARTLGVAVTTLFVTLSAGVAFPQQGPGEAPSRERLREILSRAATLRQNWCQIEDQTAREALDTESRRVIRAARFGFPEIPAGRGDQVRFVRVVLNSIGAKLDGVRIRTPSDGQEYELLWESVFPGTASTKNLQGWDIVGVDGEGVAVTDNFSRRDDFVIPGVGLPEPNTTISQFLRPQHRLRPGSEYILWYLLVTDQATPIFVKARLTPVGPAETPRTPALQKARSTYQSAVRTTNARYDAERKTLRQKYFAELDKAGKAATLEKDQKEADRIVAETREIERGDPDAGDHRGFRVIRADYGVDERWLDVTRPLREMVRGNVLRFSMTWAGFQPDPAYGVRKSLIIVYSLNGNTGVSIVRDQQMVELPPTPPSRDRIPMKQ